MTFDPNAVRLFPVAALPTPRERGDRRTYWRNAQGTLIDLAAPQPTACPVCAGEHDGPCPHGTAPALDLDHPDDDVTLARAWRDRTPEDQWPVTVDPMPEGRGYKVRHWHARYAGIDARPDTVTTVALHVARYRAHADAERHRRTIPEGTAP